MEQSSSVLHHEDVLHLLLRRRAPSTWGSLKNKLVRGTRLAQSIHHVTWSQDWEFEPHIGPRAYFKKNTEASYKYWYSITTIPRKPFSFFLFNILRERERKLEQGRGRRRGRENLKQAPCPDTGLDVGLDLMTVRSLPESNQESDS